MNKKKIWFEDVDWNHLARDKIYRRVIFNTVIEPGIALNARNLLTS
jgi:hypothetical protein